MEEGGDKVAPTFFSARVPMVAPGPYDVFRGGRILSMTGRPVWEDRRGSQGRYVIWEDDGGKIRTAWLGESVAAEQIPEGGRVFPCRTGMETASEPRGDCGHHYAASVDRRGGSGRRMVAPKK